jgi:hypothetical protein
MRLEPGGKVVLSERNLLTLLTKLYTPGSACEIKGGEDALGLSVHAEPDTVHYGGREVPAGRMHPGTERVLRAIQDAKPDLE